MTGPEWLRVCALWANLWPNRPLPPEAAAAWFPLLEDLDGATVRDALYAWAADPDRSWPPQSPGELRSVLLPVEDWTGALADLADAIHRHGYYGGMPADLDPAVRTYVRSVGGWRTLCSSWDATNPATRAQFRDHYLAARKADRQRHTLELASRAAGQITTDRRPQLPRPDHG